MTIQQRQHSTRRHLIRTGTLVVLAVVLFGSISIAAEAAVFRTRLLDKGPFTLGSTFRVEVCIEDNATSLSTYALGVVYTSSTLMLLPKAEGIQFNHKDFQLNDCSQARATGRGLAHVNFAGISPRGTGPNVHLFTLTFRVLKIGPEAYVGLNAMRPGIVPLHDTTLPEPQPIEAKFDFRATHRIPLVLRLSPAPPQPPSSP